jgi:hypothetical protein
VALNTKKITFVEGKYKVAAGIDNELVCEKKVLKGK